MKNLFILSLSVILFFNCTNKHFEKVEADSLFANIDKYANTDVEVEGIIMHICGVDGKKMKLVTPNGNVIKIVPSDNGKIYNNSYNKTTVRVQGKVAETKIENDYIEKMNQQKVPLCHIDNTPCKDSLWVKRQFETGRADTLLTKDIDRLKGRMAQSTKNYISNVTIIAENIEIIKEAE